MDKFNLLFLPLSLDSFFFRLRRFFQHFKRFIRTLNFNKNRTRTTTRVQHHHHHWDVDYEQTEYPDFQHLHTRACMNRGSKWTGRSVGNNSIAIVFFLPVLRLYILFGFGAPSIGHALCWTQCKHFCVRVCMCVFIYEWRNILNCPVDFLTKNVTFFLFPYFFFFFGF